VPLVTVQELIDAGVHYGHQASRWNPKMKPYIYGKRHNIHVLDLQETVRGLYAGTHFLRSLAATGAQILFLGTKRQIRPVVAAQSARCGMPAVTERWIGGTLTNFHTVRERLARLEQLEAMEADGTMERHKKKAQSMLRREMRKIARNLEGVRDLSGMPGAIVIVDPRREEITMREAAKMNVPVVCVLDTDCDPEPADIVIPANDDAMGSVQLILSKLADAVIEGRSSVDEQTLAEAQRAARDDVRARQVMGRTRNDSRGGRGGRGGPGGRRQGGGGGHGGGGGGSAGGLASAGRGGRFAGAKTTAHADTISIGDAEVAATPEEAKAHSVEPGSVPAPGAPAPAPAAPAPEAAPAPAPAPAPEASEPKAPEQPPEGSGS